MAAKGVCKCDFERRPHINGVATWSDLSLMCYIDVLVLRTISVLKHPPTAPAPEKDAHCRICGLHWLFLGR